jgi:hypothetical protein
MYWEQCIVALSLVGAISLAFAAARLPERRVRLAIPAGLLSLMAVYELCMLRWEKTVHAPIRIDLVVEIPLMFVLVAWGIAALLLPKRRDQKES